MCESVCVCVCFSAIRPHAFTESVLFCCFDNLMQDFFQKNRYEAMYGNNNRAYILVAFGRVYRLVEGARAVNGIQGVTGIQASLNQ